MALPDNAGLPDNGVNCPIIDFRYYTNHSLALGAFPSLQNKQIGFLFWTTAALFLRNFKEVLIFLTYINMNTYPIVLLFLEKNAPIFDFITHFNLQKCLL
jgi:hypothetical protein